MSLLAVASPLALPLSLLLGVAHADLGAQVLPEATEATGATVAQEEGDRHVADGTHVQVTTLWRSERGLDMHARVCARIGDAVVAALPRIAGIPERASGAPLLPLAIHSSPADLRRALAGGQPVGRRKRGRKDKGGAQDAGPTDAAPVPISRRGDPAAGGTLLATAPKVEDRPMFGTGIPPVARWAVALEAAHAGLYGAAGLDAAARDGAALVAAHAGLAATGFARPELHLDPYTSTGLAALRDQLADVPAEERAVALLRIAAEPPLDHLEFTATGPFAATAAEAARALLHLAARSAELAAPGATDPSALAAWAVGHLAAHAPAWSLEVGSVGAHEFGWQVVAPRRSDALVLSADPLGERAFTLRTAFLILSNDLTSPAQADIVIGDFDGDRYLLACNTREGIYLFHRSGHGQPYEAVTEFKEVPIPIGEAVDVVIRWDGRELAINVRGADLPKQTLESGAMSGRYGFGAHANVSALFRELVID